MMIIKMPKAKRGAKVKGTISLTIPEKVYSKICFDLPKAVMPLVQQLSGTASLNLTKSKTGDILLTVTNE